VPGRRCRVGCVLCYGESGSGASLGALCGRKSDRFGTFNECVGRRPQANAFRGVVVAVRVMTGGATCVAEF
jgi:hypothetical protein